MYSLPASTAGTGVITWASDPVRPDETVLLYGGGFPDGAQVEIARVADDSSAEGGLEQVRWQAVQPLQGTDKSLKVVLPASQPQGLFAARVRSSGGTSDPVFINAPDPWWLQGDGGDFATPGGWVRIMGKSLAFDRPARIALRAASGARVEFTDAKSNGFALRCDLPPTLAEGAYEVSVHNGYAGEAGWRPGGSLTVARRPAWPAEVFNVKTLGLNTALEKAAANGGGVVYFPRGRYKMEGAIVVPPQTTLRGEGMGLVSLYWEDLNPHPPALITGKSIALEDLSIYTQNMHRFVIHATGDGFGMRRVRVRANPYFMFTRMHTEFRGRKSNVDFSKVLAVLRLERANNFEITDCDILAGRTALQPWWVKNGLIARNKVRFGGNGLGFESIDRVIVEDNDIEGADLSATGSYFATFFGTAGQHLYMHRNRFAAAYGEDRELMTFDAAGAAYMGRLAEVKATKLVLAADPVVKRYETNPPASWRGAAVCILDGKGAGQYRRVAANEGRQWEIDRPFTIEPDATSLITIVPFRGRVIYVDNEFVDGGAIQLYGIAMDCIFSHNRGARIDGFATWGKEAKGWSWQPSWFFQILDCRITEGNGYGGRRSQFLTQSSVTANHDQYRGPLNRCVIFRRNVIDSNGDIAIGGATSDVIVEQCAVSASDNGIEVRKGPDGVLLRKNVFRDVVRPLHGEGLKNALVIE